MGYLKVKNWEKFQHYKDRCPPWIKLQTDTFQNYEFSKLKDASKLLALCIWTLASRSKDGIFPGDVAWIKSQCNVQCANEENLKELLDHGFIESASEVIADRKQTARPETEGETEERQRQRHKNGFLKNGGDVNGKQKPITGTSEGERIAAIILEQERSMVS